MRRLLLAALPLLVAGCTIPGQGLVGPTPQRPSQATAQDIAAQADRVPLVTIGATAGPDEYQSALAQAVRQAQALKPDVMFDVLSAVPRKGTPTKQTLAAKALTPDATEVAQAIMGDGVPVERITLGAVIVPGIPGDEVRVYVR
jgi:hypothetical protein